MPGGPPDWWVSAALLFAVFGCGFAVGACCAGTRAMRLYREADRQLAEALRGIRRHGAGRRAAR